MKHRAKSAVIPANKRTIRNYGWHEDVLNKLMLPKRLLLQNICFRCNLSSISKFAWFAIRLCFKNDSFELQGKFNTNDVFFWTSNPSKIFLSNRGRKTKSSAGGFILAASPNLMYPWEIARRSREPSRIHRYLPPFDLQYHTPSRLWQKLEHSSFCHRCEVLKIKRPWVGDRKTPCRSKPWPNYDDWAPKKVLW